MQVPARFHNLRIIHAGARYVVIDKPAGMLSVPGKGPEKQDCIAARVASAFPDASGPLIVHRLDMETSGLMALGLDPEAQRKLSIQFERRQVEKEYVALLGESTGDGEDPLSAEAGEVSLPMRLDIDNRPRQIVDHVLGRPALTRWRILARETDRIRVQFVPETGRTHQLRIHAAYGLLRPIIGDTLYGGAPAGRLMLHATKLSFMEPGGTRRVEFESAAPF